MLCGGPAIHLFSATELERLVCGNPLLDFDAMQANARYDGGYSPEHRVRPHHDLLLAGRALCLGKYMCSSHVQMMLLYPLAWLLTVRLRTLVHGTQEFAASIDW